MPGRTGTPWLDAAAAVTDNRAVARTKKPLLLAIGAVLACLVVVLVTLRVVGLEPRERRPGLWLGGTLVTAPVSDWSFTDTYQTIFVQTRTWYGVPHSVTTVCVAHEGRLYLTSTYPPGGRFPDDRAWNRNVVRDPRVRLKIGERLFDARLALVSDPAEKNAVLEAKARKYSRSPVVDGARVHVFRVAPG